MRAHRSTGSPYARGGRQRNPPKQQNPASAWGTGTGSAALTAGKTQYKKIKSIYAIKEPKIQKNDKLKFSRTSMVAKKN